MSSSTRRKRNALQSQTPKPIKTPRQDHPQEEQKGEEEIGNDHNKPISSVPYLPTPIIFEILLRVGIKTLFNCRLVCKSWADLIFTPEFAQLHLSRSPTSCLVKPLNKKRQSKGLQLVDPECPCSLENTLVFTPKTNLPNVPLGLLNSCNGLVCLCKPTYDDYDYACNIYVCNPVLGEYITIPKPRNVTIFQSFSCALGFSHKTNQYKVVFNSYCPDNGNFWTEIYTLGQGSWRSIENGPYCIWKNYYNAFVNGAIHWLECESPCPFICCFDFVNEQFRGVPEPSEFGPCPLDTLHCDDMKVGVIKGNLSICDYSCGDHIDIWVMKNYGVKESWSKDFVITHMINETHYEPILITGNGEILLIHNNSSILLYDPKSNAYVSELKIFGARSEFHGIAHVPSLISLKDILKGGDLKVLGRN